MSSCFLYIKTKVIEIGAELNTKVYRSWSWLIRLVKILLLLYSKIYVRVESSGLNFFSFYFILNLVSRLPKVDLVFLIFFSYFYFLFNLFSFILFLELGLGLEWQYHAVTQEVTSDDMVTSHLVVEVRSFWIDR